MRDDHDLSPEAQPFDRRRFLTRTAMAGAAAIASPAIVAAGVVDGQPGTTQAPMASAGRVAPLELDEVTVAQLRAAISAGQIVSVKDFGAKGDGVTDDTAAIQAANDACAGEGVLRIPPGTGNYRIASALLLNCNLQATGAQFEVLATGSVTYGNPTSGSYIQRKVAYFPRITNGDTARLPAIWAGSSIGLKLINCSSCELHVPGVENFHAGVKLGGLGTGAVFNLLHLGRIYNNKVNVLFSSGALGWCNQNTTYGGELTHNSAIGVAVAGCRHILLDAIGVGFGPPNGNTFIGTAVEGDVPAFNIECYGSDNIFLNVRFEATAPKIQFNSAYATNNMILGGYYSWYNLVVTNVNTAHANNLIAGGKVVRESSGSGAGLLDSNFELAVNSTGAASPVRRIYRAEADAWTADATAWQVSETADLISYKATGDAGFRLQIDPVSGRVNFGDGSGTLIGSVRALNGVLYSDDALFRIKSATPANSGAAGVGGTITWDARYIYICVAANRWKRVAYTAGAW